MVIHLHFGELLSKRQKANLNCVVDENGDPRSGVEAGSVWKAYFEKLLNGGELTVSSDRAKGDGQEATDWGHDLSDSLNCEISRDEVNN